MVIITSPNQPWQPNYPLGTIKVDKTLDISVLYSCLAEDMRVFLHQVSMSLFETSIFVYYIIYDLPI